MPRQHRRTRTEAPAPPPPRPLLCSPEMVRRVRQAAARALEARHGTGRAEARARVTVLCREIGEAAYPESVRCASACSLTLLAAASQVYRIVDGPAYGWER